MTDEIAGALACIAFIATVLSIPYWPWPGSRPRSKPQIIGRNAAMRELLRKAANANR